MKTQNNITRKASRFAMTAALFVIAIASAKANNEMIAAAGRLESLNLKAEEVLRYEAPSVDRNADLAAFEFATAMERLENLINDTEKWIRFEAPAVDIAKEVVEYEAVAATERLDNLAAAIEKTIQYTPATF